MTIQLGICLGYWGKNSGHNFIKIGHDAEWVSDGSGDRVYRILDVMDMADYLVRNTYEFGRISWSDKGDNHGR